MQDKFQGREPKYYDIFTGLFVAVLLVSEITSTKIVQFGFIQTAGAAVLFPVSYIFSDILTEVYGYARARRVMWIGFASLILMSLVLIIVQKLPPSSSWHDQAAYDAILGFVPRITAASVIAYWLGGFANDFVLAKMKLLTKGKYLWTRTVGSTVVGQAVDTFLFIGLAFYGVLPNAVILQIIFSFYLFKCGYEIVATPITYFVVNKLKKSEGLDVFDYQTNFNPFRFRVDDNTSVNNI
jgi:hypothetical protein